MSLRRGVSVAFVGAVRCERDVREYTGRGVGADVVVQVLGGEDTDGECGVGRS